MRVPDWSEASQEVRRLHVQVTVDREEPVTGQSGKQLADGRLSTAAVETGGGRWERHFPHQARVHLGGGQTREE